LIVNLNSSNGDHGRSTVARLFDLTKANCINAAVNYLNSKCLKKRPFFRFIPTLQYLKILGIQITKAPESNKVPLALVEELTAVLQGMLRSKEPATVYTDGSTPVRSALPNSGCSIYITDSKDIPIWSGGMIVRSDGNNFIAELAAAAIVIKSCPPSLPLTLKIDSKAAIGALSRGRVSERKRVRAAGRAWLNFCRDEFSLKRQHIDIRHVSSHRGLNNAEQIGNDQADQIANLYRSLGEKRGPTLYFTQSEEGFTLTHKGKSIQSDVAHTSNRLRKRR
jgi:ribonuclease HI